jgi:hypothetical protein
VSADRWLRTEHTGRTWAGRILMLIVAAVLIGAGLYSIGPSWTAHIGGGSRGTFTVTRQSCGRVCEWIGDFTPSDGGPARSNVRMGYGHTGIQAIGDVVPAIDAGGSSVFPADGGYEWLLAIGALSLGATVLILWCVRLVVSLSRPVRDGYSARSRPAGE